MFLTLRTRSGGFTLVELIVVVGIIAILSSIVMVNLQDSRSHARDGKRVADMAQLELALEVYKQVHGTYPQQGDDANGIVGEGAGIDSLLSTLNTVPHDPLGPDNDEYQYYYDGSHDCDGTDYAVVFAQTVERTSNANWSEVCGGPGDEGSPDENTYMIILGPSAG